MIEFQLLNIWFKFHCKVIVLCYDHSRAPRAYSNESDETEHSVHSAEASWKLKARPTACAMSRLTHLAWENVTTT